MSVIVTGLGEAIKSIDRQVKQYNKGVDDAVVATANAIRRDAVITINKQTRGDKTVKRGKRKHYVSPEGGAPNTDTGSLVKSIEVTHIRGSKEAVVSSDLDYAAWLEFVLNRPWLEPASAGKDEVLKQNILTFTAKAMK
jgi:hypothetical protein